jgi:hypothetical protein
MHESCNIITAEYQTTQLGEKIKTNIYFSNIVITKVKIADIETVYLKVIKIIQLIITQVQISQSAVCPQINIKFSQLIA